MADHGGAGTRYVHDRCRCRLCTEANTARVERRRKARDSSQAPGPHGYSTYVNWGCRCLECKAAASRRNAAAAQRRLDNPVPERQHGRHTGYMSYGCRCEMCKLAFKQYSADRRKRKMA